jgi:archaemetzincin
VVERIVLVAVGEIELEWLESIHDALPEILGRRCRIDPHAFDPTPAANHPRRQFDASLLVERLAERLEEPDELVLGVTAVDLYLSVFTFVFGAAHLDGRAAVVSTRRLDPEHYGVQASPALLDERLVKEASHECGHLFGAVHCRNPGCVMQFSGAVEEIDLKGPHPCPECARGMRVPPGLIRDQGA